MSAIVPLQYDTVEIISRHHDQWIVQLESFITQTSPLFHDNWLAIFQIASYDIVIRKCVLATMHAQKRNERRRGREEGVINLCRGNFAKRRKVESEII